MSRRCPVSTSCWDTDLMLLCVFPSCCCCCCCLRLRSSDTYRPFQTVMLCVAWQAMRNFSLVAKRKKKKLCS
ncbi:hypothetical protein DAI22_05g149201 [Oryza sativa Japonica Group]|nr:hypothetical protein DAI22_05g149201 [Oryza sativa Japonica Group]